MMKPKKINRFRVFLQVTFVAMLVGAMLAYPKHYSLQGETMGTTFTIKAYVPFWRSENNITKRLQHRLSVITNIFSTYDDSSEISQFNKTRHQNPIQVSQEFYDLLNQAQLLNEKTFHMFDVTVLPLYRLWGFMKTEPLKSEPLSSDISKTLAYVGSDKLKFVGPGKIQKTHPLIECDLSAIAKGYAVDELSRILKQVGSKHFIVEIGGEIYASGQKGRSQNWRCAISVPKSDANPNDILYAIELKNKALATSGDYRNYQQINQKKYTHIINPKTGYPSQKKIVSASVIAKNCMLADSLATAVILLDPQKALNLIERNKAAEALLIEKTDTGFKIYQTSGFKNYIIQDLSQEKL